MNFMSSVQCDGCRVYVHQRCYGVAAPPDGRLWLCDVCTIGAAPHRSVPSTVEGLMRNCIGVAQFSLNHLAFH